MNQIEDILKKVNDAKLLAMNFACWAEPGDVSEKLWKITYCLKDCHAKLEEISNETSSDTQ